VVARGALAVLFALLFAALPATASAAIASRAPGSSTLALQENLDDETNTVTVTLSGGVYTISDSAGMGAGANCDDNTPDPDTVTCPAQPVASISADLGPGNDKFTSMVATPAKVMGGPGTDDLTGGPGADELIGGPDSDTLHGGGGNDVMKGETVAGDAGTAANTMDGGSGNDTMDGGAGPDVMMGGADADTENGGGGADDVDGGDGNDVVSGGDGNDSVSGGAGSDTVGAGDHGDDALDGGADDDVIVPGDGPGGGGASDADTIAGGPGTDEVTYAARSTSVTVTIGGGQDDGTAGEHDDVGADVEHVTGGSAPDALTGSANPEELSGGPGGDLLAGGGGPDLLEGGDGDDVIDGNVPAAPAVSGRLGAPIAGPAGLTNVSDDDTLDGGDGNDVFDGGPGADKMLGGPGSDTTSYASAVSPVLVTLDGKANDGEADEGDTVGADVENLGGWSGQDTFTGSGAGNAMVSAGGEGYLDGAGGSDSLAAGAGFDVVRSRDGQPDNVDCGSSSDFAIVDKKDTVSGSCERVDENLVKRQPRLGRTFILRPLRGGEAFGLRGMHRTVPLKDRLGLPFGAKLDATHGAVRLTAAGGGGRSATGDFSGGAFLVKQRRSAHGLTELDLTGGDLSKCSASGAHARAAAGRTVLRRLFGRAHGRFRTRGRNSTATVRGTEWSVIDRCDGTLTTVKRGTVVVRDRVKHRTVTLKSGQRYLARRGNR
jgi:Ca2+-binding RTX toxin-like protein